MGHCQRLDVFDDPLVWSAIVSGQARLDLGLDPGPGGHPALRLVFDFGTGGGFVVARRPWPLILPGSFSLHLQSRAQGQAQGIEIKLIDPSNENVWLWRSDSWDPGPDWRDLILNGRDFAFGWGPGGGGAPEELGALEIAVIGGGKGTLWLAGLELEDRTPPARPTIGATSGLSVRAEAGEWNAKDPTTGKPETPFHPERSAPWIELDCGRPCDYSALQLTWGTAGPHPLRILARDREDQDWRCLYEAPYAQGLRDLFYLGNGCSRFVRIELLASAAESAPALTDYRLLPAAYARSLEDFFARLAAESPYGHYPRWLYREQIDWTAVDRPEGRTPALISADGAIEVGRAWPMIEPVLWTGERLLTWADCVIEPGLVQPSLPIPQVTWRAGDWMLEVRAFAQGEPGWLYLGYRVARQAPAAAPADPAAKARLYLLLRPFQVTPPWQRHRELGGLAPIHRLSWDRGGLWADDRLVLVPLVEPTGAGVGSLDGGPSIERLAAGLLPGESLLEEPNGLGWAAVWFDLELAGEDEERIWLAAPLAGQGDRPSLLAGEGLGIQALMEQCLERAIAEWRVALGGGFAGETPAPPAFASAGKGSRRPLILDLPEEAAPYWEAAQGAIAHILINRQGPALHPGPRRYARSWIRDGAVMAAALNRFGLVDESLAFVAWYAGFQEPSGRVPCCVDEEGPDWLGEHDSPGQLIFAIADAWRFGAEGHLAQLWPTVCRAVAYLEQLRAERLTPEYRTPQRRACFGLLPESASHEGYLAHPVHAYWDDLWAVRGLKDAVELAESLGDQERAAHWARLRDDLAADLYRSIEQVMAEQGIEFLPGSVELADHDPVAIAVALTLVDEGHRLPPLALNRTFERFIERFRAMHGLDPVPWTNYTPYEIRIAGALIRLGWRAEAHEILDFYLAARTPPVWNQWPEIIWRDPCAPAHRGDLPHSWIGAEYALVVRDLLVYERAADRSLVIAAGIPLAWLQAGAIRIQGLPTAYGCLDLEIERWMGSTLVVQIGGALSLPPGGIWVCPPLPGPLYAVRINGEPSRDYTATSAHVGSIPARLELLA